MASSRERLRRAPVRVLACVCLLMALVGTTVARSESQPASRVEAAGARISSVYGGITSKLKTKADVVGSGVAVREVLGKQSDAFDIAAGHYLLVPTMDPDYVAAKGQLDEASKALSRSAGSREVEGLRLILGLTRANISRQTGDFRVAEQEYVKVISQGPDESTAGAAIGGLFAVGVATHAEAAFVGKIEDLATRYPSPPVREATLHWTGTYELQRKQYGNARKTFERLKQDFPQDSEFADAMLAQIPSRSVWQSIVENMRIWVAVVLIALGIALLRKYRRLAPRQPRAC